MCHPSNRLPAQFLALALLLGVVLACIESPPNPPPPPPVTQELPTPVATITPSSSSPEMIACLDSIPVYPNAQEDLAAEEVGKRVYVAQDSMNPVKEFYKANLTNLNCREVTPPRVEKGDTFSWSCKNDNMNVLIDLLDSPGRSQGIVISIECVPQS